jgi:hypothetical protein
MELSGLLKALAWQNQHYLAKGRRKKLKMTLDKLCQLGYDTPRKIEYETFRV